MRGIAGISGFVLGGGYSEEIAVVNVAVQDAGVLDVAAVGEHVGDPRVLPLLVKVTVPVGGLPLLCVPTTAVSVTLVPEGTLGALVATVVVVGVC